eukprot:gene2116-1983_t
MGKDRKWSTKKIWNNLGKSRLNFYCPMCQKQCRDAQGFKSHCESDAHNHQMQLFSENEEMYIEQFSKDFIKEFMDSLKRRYKTSKVLANDVYQQYINETHHVHLSSTKWVNLDEFVSYLGKESICKVEESPKGLVVQYVDIDDSKIKKMEQEKEREQLKLNDEERLLRTLEKQVEAAKKLEKTQEKSDIQLGDLKNENEFPVKLDLNFKQQEETKEEKLSNLFSETEKKSNKRKRETENKKISNLTSIIQEEEKRKEKRNRRDYWLHEGIIVKIMSKIESKKYYKKKGKVLKVIDNYVGEIEMSDSKDVLRIDQSDLETVIPKIGNEVMIVNGAYREEICTLESIDVDNFCANLKSKLLNQMIKRVPYEDFSKI